MLVLVYHKLVKYPSFDLWWKTFDLELSIIKSCFKVVSWQEVLECVLYGNCVKDGVLISFDDGYADNWVYAYPLLKKHGLRALLFVATSRVVKSQKVRPNLEDYWKGKVSFKELHKAKSMFEANLEFLRFGKSEDFLTLGELRTMGDVFDFGWHSHWHTKSFYQETILDFFDGRLSHWSLRWAYQEEPKVGFPVFPLKSSLTVRIGMLRQEIKEYIKGLEPCFFRRKGWKEELRRELEVSFGKLLEFEGEQERISRLREETLGAKQELEELTGRQILCGAYPFGEYDEVLKKEVSKVLKCAFTTEKTFVKEGQDPYLIPRITVPKDIWSFLAILSKFKASSR